MSQNEILDLKNLKSKILVFAQKRDWEKFHTPKNIAMALSVEASELLEIFQWLTENESFQIKKNKKEKIKVEEELSDIFVYLVRLCDLLDIDLSKSVTKKMKKNAKKYPVKKSRGHAKKYYELK